MPLKLPSFRARRDVYPPDLWTKCPTCSTMLFNKQLDKNLRVCTTCGHHFRLSASARLEHLVDHGTWAERDADLQSVDALGFVDQKPYPDRLAAAQLATGMRDAAVWGTARIGGRDRRPVRHGLRVHGRLDGRGRRREGHPGRRARPGRAHPAHRRQRLGRRAHAGGHAGPHAAGQDHGRAGAPGGRPACRSCQSCPTRPRAACSPRSRRVGDVNIAEPDALIGFAGARVAAGTIAAELPEGFQRAEFLSSHGFVDRVVPRADLRAELARLLRSCPAAAARGADRRRWPTDVPGVPAAVVPVDPRRPGRCEMAGGDGLRAGGDGAARRRLVTATDGDGDGRHAVDGPATTAVLPPLDAGRPPTRPGTPSGRASSWRARSRARGPSSSWPRMAEESVELHGDRLFGDDAAMVAALARIDGRRGRGHRPAEGRRHRREHPAQLRHAPPRGLSQGDARDAPGRALRAAGRHLRRRPRRASRSGVGGARHRRGHRPLDRPDDPPAHADRHGHHRRGRFRWRAGHRRRRRRHRPRERGLLGHQPGGLRVDPVAQPGRGRHGGRRDAPDRRRPARPGRRRPRRRRARRRRPRRPGGDGPPAQGRSCSTGWRPSRR